MRKIFYDELLKGYKKDKLKPNKTTNVIDDVVIEVGSHYDLEIEITEDPTNPIIIETVQFVGFEEGTVFTPLQTISTASTTTITTTETQNYIRVSSGGLEVGTDVAIQLIVKKKIV